VCCVVVRKKRNKMGRGGGGGGGGKGGGGTMEWNQSTSTQKKKFKATPLAGKSWTLFFWDGEEVILVDIMPHDPTIK